MSEHRPLRRGRKPLCDEPMNSVSTWVPQSEHDRLITLANRERMSVSAVLRQLVTKAVGQREKST